MAMNLLHQWLCRSDGWARHMRTRVLPWACDGVELGGNVLELGPGYGITTRWLLTHGGQLSAVEADPTLAGRIRNELADLADVYTGSATNLPFPDSTFDVVVCFTMLHHLPSPQQQDLLFTEVARVLRPGGVFAGSDSTPSLPFRLLHLGDTMVVVDPDTLPDRLHHAGLEDARTERDGHSQRFHATRPRPTV